MHVATPSHHPDEQEVSSERKSKCAEFIEAARFEFAAYLRAKNDSTKGKIAYSTVKDILLAEIKENEYSLEELFEVIRIKRSSASMRALIKFLNDHADWINKNIGKSNLLIAAEYLASNLKSLKDLIDRQKFNFAQFRAQIRVALQDEEKRIALQLVTKNKSIPDSLRLIILHVLQGEPEPPVPDHEPNPETLEKRRIFDRQRAKRKRDKHKNED